ncbi:MAG: hypothetical protein L3K08_02365, partial [Thermoplasmata archaeon]|nr:hypothetical protein [Thermoplasmata archaeon]
THDFTGGGLLYAMDNVGAYSWQDFFLRPRTDYLLPSAISGLVLGQTYTAFYLTVFAETFLVVLAIGTFCRALLKRSFGKWDLRFAGIIAGGLFLASPVLMTYRYASIMSAIFVSTAALTFAFAFLIDAIRGLRENEVFPWQRGVLLGIALGMSGPDSLPNDARVVAVEALALLAFLVLFLMIALAGTARRRPATRSFLHVLLVSVPIGAALLSYPFYVFLTSKGFGISTVGGVASAFTPQLQSGSWNTIDATVRLLGRRSFTATAYYSTYYTSVTWVGDVVQAATYLLPLLALVIPLVIALLWKFPDRWLVVPLTIVTIAGAIWEAGSNPPLGSIYTSVVGYLPYGATFFQTYSITDLILDKFYPVLIAFSIVTLSRLAVPILFPPGGRSATPAPLVLPPWEGVVRPASRSRGPRGDPLTRALILVALTGSTALAALPILNGAVDQNWIPPGYPGYGERGIFIPNEYATVRSMLQERHGNAILLPQVSAYVRTSWGFNGANGFYEAYYFPSQILVPGYYGPYASYIPSFVQNYTSATNPLVPGTPSVPLNATFSSVVHPSLPASGGIRYDYHLGGKTPTLDLNGTEWLTMDVGISNESRIRQIILDGNLWVGLTSGPFNQSTPSWFNIAGGSNGVLDSLNATSLTVSVLPADPGSPPQGTGSRGGTDLSAVGTVTFWAREPVDTFGFIQGPPVLSITNATGVASSWFSQLHSYQMGYLIVDRSLLVNGTGNQQPASLVDAIVSTLEAGGTLEPLYQGHYLDLYQLVSTSFTPDEASSGVAPG